MVIEPAEFETLKFYCILIKKNIAKTILFDVRENSEISVFEIQEIYCISLLLMPSVLVVSAI